MSGNAEVVRANTPKNPEIVVRFSPEGVRAPFLLRCGALLVDYLLIVTFPAVFLVFGRLSGDDGARLLSGSWNTVGWLIGLLFAVTNIVVLPVFSGQSFGKIVTGIRVVALNGSAPLHKKMFLRQTLGYIVTGLSAGFGFLFSIFSNKGRALHDYIAGTVVIYADRNVRDR